MPLEKIGTSWIRDELTKKLRTSWIWDELTGNHKGQCYVRRGRKLWGIPILLYYEIRKKHDISRCLKFENFAGHNSSKTKISTTLHIIIWLL